MNRIFSLACLPLAAGLFLGCLPVCLNGQEPPADDPFGEAKAAPAVAAKPAEAAAAKVEETERDPNILAVRETKPSGPRQLVWAARTVLDLGRPDEAQKYLKRLLDAAPDAAVLADLQRHFGSGLFVRFLGDERLRPEGQQLGQAVLNAATAAARDPARLQSLIAKLTDRDPDVRRMALVDLRDADSAAAAALLVVLADSRRAAEHAAALDALVALGPVAEGPLVGALLAPDPAAQSQAIGALGLLGSRGALPYLLRPLLADASTPQVRQAAEQALKRILGALPSREEAVRYLRREVTGRLAGRAVEGEDPTSIWLWDESRGTLVEQPLSARAAESWTASRIGTELRTLAPDAAEARQLYLTALLEWDQARVRENLPAANGLGSARESLAGIDAAALEEVLVFALDNGRTAAAVRALEALAEAGDERLLDSPDGRPRPAAAALQHRERAIRFAAVETIMRWDPTSPYPGSSYLPETLAYLASTSGSPRVLIGHPRPDVAQTLVAVLNEIGFAADSTPTGRQLFASATSSPDYEMILVSDSLDSPPVEELIQQLRREARTASLPVGVMTREANQERMQRFAEQDPLTTSFPRPFDARGVAYQVRKLLALGDEEGLAAGERMRQAKVALDHLGRLAKNRARYAFYDVLAQQDAVAGALSQSALTVQAAHFLGSVGSPAAQRTLVTLASENSRSLSQRRAAASSFALAVAHRGLLLSREEILLQYDRYNRSAQLDQETRQILGSILDAIEAPSQAKE